MGPLPGPGPGPAPRARAGPGPRPFAVYGRPQKKTHPRKNNMTHILKCVICVVVPFLWNFTNMPSPRNFYHYKNGIESL